MEAVDAASFELEAPDARTGAQRTGTFYAGDRNAPVLKATSSGAWVWSGPKHGLHRIVTQANKQTGPKTRQQTCQQ